jgi:hypothetical protein
MIKTCVKLRAQQRRELKRLSPVVGRATESDRRLFRRCPERAYRLRNAARAEVAANEQLGHDPTLPSGFRWYDAVKQVAPGARMRAIFAAHEGNDTDEPESREVYARVANSDSIRVVEQQLAEVVAARGAAS